MKITILSKLSLLNKKCVLIPVLEKFLLKKNKFTFTIILFKRNNMGAVLKKSLGFQNDEKKCENQYTQKSEFKNTFQVIQN